MTTSPKLVAGDSFPIIKADLLDGSSIQLGAAQGEATWQMVIVYRGVHCPLCTRYLNILEEFKVQLSEIGVDIVAISADSKQQLQTHSEQLDVTYPVAYGLTEDQMKQLGLYISMPRSEKETDHNFAEPGLFIVNEQGNVQAVDISNTPFLRPEISVVLRGLTFVRNQDDYPIRGTLSY
ncbi:redoxin domain-containing protein [Vibrio sp. MA40-2]|uniref:redoxin domain-containing protein n=1 Tax=Vibrio sp. MA40-2 TaxID=3391828 RepID=UPI0039A49575